MPVIVEFLNPGVTRALERDLQQLAADFSKRGGFHEPFEKIVREVFMPSIQQNFDMGGRPKRWEPVAPETERRAGGGSILKRTGKLYNAAKALARWTIKDNTAVYDLTSFPERAWYGIVHDQGYNAGTWDIPQRQFAMIQMPEDGNHAIEILADWVRRKVLDRTRRVYR